MKVELDLQTDNYNSYPTEKLEIDFFDDDKKQKYVWLKIGDRQISILKDEFKKIINII